MVLGSLDCILHLLRMVAEQGEDQHTRQTGNLLVPHQMVTARAYSLHLTQLLAVVCQKKIKMWLSSS